MTALSHLDQDFSTVAAIEAVNEPIMDANLTPGYGDCSYFIFGSCLTRFISLLIVT